MGDIDPERAVALAVSAAGTAPSDPVERSHWLGNVRSLAVDLYRLAEAVRPDLEVLAQVRPVTGIVRKVTEQSGRAVISFEATMGDEPGKLEDVRTPWLNTAQGAQMAEFARSLVGQPAVFGKWLEKIESGPKKGQSVRMCAWIEPAGQTHAPASSQAEDRPTPPEPERPPEREQPRAAPEPEPEPPSGEATDGRVGEPRADMGDDELGAFHPPTSVVLVQWAQRALGIDEDAVRRIASKTLPPLEEGRRRTASELKALWKACVLERAF